MANKGGSYIKETPESEPVLVERTKSLTEVKTEQVKEQKKG